MQKRMSNFNRRLFLRQSLGVAAGVWLSNSVQASPDALGSRRTLSFYNLHTNERLRAQYWSNGGYDKSALEDIAFVLRDFRTNEVKSIDTQLLDLLTAVQTRLSGRREFQVISGYRSPKTNAMLNARSNGVAKRSLHMQGRAIDVHLAGIPLSTLRQTGQDLGLGGVGFYPKSGFVHFDTGRPRWWAG
ncbi:MAG: YcbK family protein [Arenicellales bacterium]|nr:YcbK family protein [Arenicellales bacterium]